VAENNAIANTRFPQDNFFLEDNVASSIAVTPVFKYRCVVSSHRGNFRWSLSTAMG
jgi:hypothetical protein